MISIILGIGLIVAAIAMLFIAFGRTPTNLRGFYGTMYIAFAVALAVGGVGLIIL